MNVLDRRAESISEIQSNLLSLELIHGSQLPKDWAKSVLEGTFSLIVEKVADNLTYFTVQQIYYYCSAYGDNADVKKKLADAEDLLKTISEIHTKQIVDLIAYATRQGPLYAHPHLRKLAGLTLSNFLKDSGPNSDNPDVVEMHKNIEAYCVAKDPKFLYCNIPPITKSQTVFLYLIAGELGDILIKKGPLGLRLEHEAILKKYTEEKGHEE